MEDKVRIVGVRRRFVRASVDPTWASPGHPSPLSVPLRPDLPSSPASGTARVPAPLRKLHAIRRARKCPRYGVYASASISLLCQFGATDSRAGECDALLYTYPHAYVKRRAFECCPPQPSSCPSIVTRLSTRTGFPLLPGEGSGESGRAQTRRMAVYTQ